jgi:outer membrane protein insertion porin family
MRTLATLTAFVCSVGALAATPRPAHAEGEPIVEIEVVENTKTNDETVRLIADVHKGDSFSYALLDRIRVDLVNSGLFKDVQVIGVPAPGGMKLTIVAKDKHSWVIAPTVYLQPGNKGGGVGYGENNLFGTNKKLLLYGQIATADSMFIAGYLDPAFLGSPLYFRADTFLRREFVTEFSGGDLFDEPRPDRTTRMNYYNFGFMLGLNVWKGMAVDVRLRGAWVEFGSPECEQESVMPPGSRECDSERPGENGWDVSTETRLTYDKRANWYGVTAGGLFGLSYEKGLPGLGSDFDYWIATVRGIKAWRFFEEHNLTLKGSAALGRNLPFQQELTSGGVNLRGYQNREFRGDTKVAGTFEYGVPFFKLGSLAFRGLVFSDLAYTIFTSEEKDNPQRHYLKDQTKFDADSLRLGMGAGFRIYVRSIVMPLLGVDWGYAPQSNEYHVYFAVGLTEL